MTDTQIDFLVGYFFGLVVMWVYLEVIKPAIRRRMEGHQGVRIMSEKEYEDYLTRRYGRYAAHNLTYGDARGADDIAKHE